MLSESQLWKKAAIVSLAITFMISAGSAEMKLEMSQQDEVLWLNQNALNLNSQLEAQASCERMVNGSDVGEIRKLAIYDEYSNLEKEENPPGSSGNITFQANSRETGKYFVQLQCENGRDTVEDFYIDRIHVDITSPEDNPFYMGSSDEIRVALTSEEGQIQHSNFDRVEAEIDGNNVDQYVLGAQEINFGRETVVRVQNVPKDLTAKDVADADLTVTAEYEERKESGRTVLWREEDQKEVSLKRWNLKKQFRPGQRVSSKRVGDVNVSLQMSYEGEAVDSLEARHFYLKRGERNDAGDYEWFSGGHVRNTGDGKFGVYSLSLEKMPQLDVGDHTLDIYFESDDHGPKKVGTVYVEKKFTFDGRVTDSDSRAVDSFFRMDSGEYFEEFTTDSRGFFERRVMPGEYGFDLCFRSGGNCDNAESKLLLQDVELRRNYSAEINYDYFSDFSNVDPGIKGVEPINMMTVSFGYPFKQGQGVMKYNPADIEDPKEVSVYECNNWNFWGKSCATEWERLDDDDVHIPPTGWSAKFPLDPIKTSEYGEEKNVLLSAYVVGKKAALRVSRLTVNDYRIREGDDLTVEGRVVSRGARVENADVTVSLMNGDLPVEQVSGTTNSDGEFSIDLTGEETGNFTVNVEARKGSYETYNNEVDGEISVYEETDLSLNVPSQLDIRPGKTSSAELQVSNSGQTPFENVQLRVQGPAQAELSEGNLGTMESGDSQTVTVDITVPEDFCNPSCSQYPTYDLTLSGESEGESIEKDYNLQTQVVRQQNSQSGGQQSQQTQEEPQNNNSDGFASVGDFATGEFLNDQSSTNMALGLIIVFSLALAAAVKKKKSEDDSGRDVTRTANLQKPEVQPSASLQEDEKIKAVATSIDNKDSDKIKQEDEKIEELAAAFDEGNETEAEAEEVEKQARKSEPDKEQESAGSWLSKLREQEAVEQEQASEAEPETEQVTKEQEAEEDQSEQKTEVTHECDKCGEEFDTESGLKLHREAMHSNNSDEKQE